jgi:hypothetical protein
MQLIPLIIHERRANWARQLRPRVASSSLRVIETRGASDLAAAYSAHEFALSVIDLADRPAAALAELAEALTAARESLVLVLDPTRLAEIATLARELGATEVWAGFVPPPRVARLVHRWGTLLRRRAAACGFYPSSDLPTTHPSEFTIDTIIRMAAPA